METLQPKPMDDDHGVEEFEADTEIIIPDCAHRVRVPTLEAFQFKVSLLKKFIVRYIELHRHQTTDRDFFLHIGRVCVTRPLIQFFYNFKHQLAAFLLNFFDPDKIVHDTTDMNRCYLWCLRISEDLCLNWLQLPLESFLSKLDLRTEEIPGVDNVSAFLVQKCRDWIDLETYQGFLYDILSHNFVIVSMDNLGENDEKRRYYTLTQFEEAALAFCELSLERNCGAVASVMPQDLYSHIFLKYFGMENSFENIAMPSS